MENSTYESIYTAVYTFLFLIALTITIFMFKTIYDYAELSYDYSSKALNESVIVNAPISKYKLIQGEEVVSYFYNYIKRDAYGISKSDIQYRVNINNLTGEVFSSINTPPIIINNTTFYDIINKIKINSKYVITYKSESGGLIYIDITEATNEQINAIV